MEAWNKMSLEQAKEKALSYNSSLNIIRVYRDDNKLKFNIICPCCNKKEIEGTSMSAIKNNFLSCKDCKKEKISKSNSKVKEGNSFEENDLYNRIEYWDYSKNKLIPKEVSKGSGKKFWFNCEEGHSFEMRISDVNKGRWCQHCSSISKESRMATTLKQVLKHEFKNTLWEHNIGFKGFNGGTSNYDIYIPEINLLIECQSQYHDDINQKELDIIKKQYAIDEGYNFLEIDHRSFTPLQSVQLFFPYINKIPKYVDYTKNTEITWDVKKAQYLLDNSNLSQKEIAEEIDAGIRSFYHAISYGTLIVPQDKRIEVPIVQISLDGKFINKYKSARECYNQTGFSVTNLCNCCKHTQQTYKGFLWIYEEEYNKNKDNNGNLEISEEENKKLNKNITKSILKLSLDGEYLEEYDSLSDIERKTGYSLKNISANCYNKRSKTSNGYIWMFKNDYLDLKEIKEINPKNIILYKTNKYEKL